MNFLGIFILFTFTLTTSFGYKSDCNEKISESCTVWMTLDDPVFTKLFLPVLYPMIELSIDYIMENEAPGAQSYKKINEIIEKQVDDSTIEKFVNLLDNVLYRRSIKVVVVEDINEGSGNLVTNVNAPETPIQTVVKEGVPKIITTHMRSTRAPITYRPIVPINTANRNRGGIGYALMRL